MSTETEILGFGLWDFALIGGVSLQATTMAYMFRPKWKALLYCLPIPFTLASLSVGAPVGPTHLVGLLGLLGFFLVVRSLYEHLKCPIVPSILVGALSYVGAACALRPIMPKGDTMFWVVAAATGAMGLTLFFVLPIRHERGHKSPLPVWAKLPAVASVIVGLVLLKQYMAGFMAMFPMMGVITAYEGRHSLWTITRQVPIILLTFVPMMAFCRLTQDQIGLGGALAGGWIIHLSVLGLATKWLWNRTKAVERGAAS